MKISKCVKNKKTTLTKDVSIFFGSLNEGIIEVPAITKDGQVIEVGYYFGGLKSKPIISISAQVGCMSKCNFCELGKEKFIRNLTAQEMYEEVILMLQVAKQQNIHLDKIHKVSIAKTGEPLFNKDLVTAMEKISEFNFYFKVSTIFPEGDLSQEIFYQIAQFSSQYAYPVQIQISLISTNEYYRKKATGIKIISFKKLREMAEKWKKINPKGRKINLSLIISENTPCDVNEVCDLLPPELFRFRFRPYVSTKNGNNELLKTTTSARYSDIKKSFEDKGYDLGGDLAKPTDIESKFGLVSNATRRRYQEWISENMEGI